jgi:acetyltransferase-like isoleucine patch superfamily enzyme
MAAIGKQGHGRTKSCMSRKGQSGCDRNLEWWRMRLSPYYWWLQFKGRAIFGRRVGILGNFTVVNPRNVTIGRDCGINHGVFILGSHSVAIGDRVVLSAGVMLIDAGLSLSEFAASDFPSHVGGPIRIDDGAWIGAGAIVLSGVTIGKCAVVGAGSVVTKDVPPYTIVAGNPARVIGRTDE